MSDPDPAREYAALRSQTAQTLNLDLADLSPADGLKLDLTSLLRLSLDSLQGAALAGREVDLSRLQSCYGMLAKLLPAAVEAPPQLREDHSVRAKVAALLNGYETARRFEEAESDERLFEALAADALAEKTAALTSLLLGTPPPAALAPASTPTTQSPQPPLPPASSTPPAHYLRDGSEPWRGAVEGGRDRWSNRG
jgi:hypothetical protein